MRKYFKLGGDTHVTKEGKTAKKGLLSWGKSKVSPTITRVKGKYISK